MSEVLKFVSPEYQLSLEKLADTLVERFKTTEQTIGQLTLGEWIG